MASERVSSNSAPLIEQVPATTPSPGVFLRRASIVFRVRGKVSVLRTIPGGVEQPLRVLEDGDFFGEIALLEDVRRTFTVRAVVATLLLVLTHPHFLRLLDAALGGGARWRRPPGASRLTTPRTKASRSYLRTQTYEQERQIQRRDALASDPRQGTAGRIGR